MEEIRREYHKASMIFPLLQGDEFEALKADIAADGLLEPIWLHSNGSILDGRNRHRACIETGTPPRFRTWDGKGSLVALVVSMNLHRRHLTSSQRAVIALDILPMLEAEAKERQRGGQGGILLSQKIEQAKDGKATQQAAAITQTNRQYVSDAKKLRDEAPELLEAIRRGEVTIPQAKRKRQKEERDQTAANILESLPTGKYQCIVIDPPWPTQKILRDKRPNQDLLDYPTMTVEEISRLSIDDLAHEGGCHIYLWTTHKYLPAAFDLFSQWGVKYQCIMTWVKPTGMTPYSWMYNTELVLFGRIGSLKLERMGLKLSFDAPVTKHSEKPGVFYERVRLASPSPRLDIFARKPREGFEIWGDEI